MPILTGLGCAPPTSGNASADAAAVDWPMNVRRLLMDDLLLREASMELRGKLGADPDLGGDAAYTGQLHLVLIAVGPIQPLQPLHRALVGVVHQPVDGEQRGARGDTQRARDGGVGRACRDALRGAPDVHARAF